MTMVTSRGLDDGPARGDGYRLRLHRHHAHLERPLSRISAAPAQRITTTQNGWRFLSIAMTFESGMGSVGEAIIDDPTVPRPLDVARSWPGLLPGDHHPTSGPPGATPLLYR